MPQVLILDEEAERYRAVLAERFPEVVFYAATSAGAALESAGEAAIWVVRPRLVTEDLAARAKKLRLIQLLIAGTDGIAPLRAAAPHALIATLRGMHVPQMSELAIMMMLGLARRLPAMQRNQQQRVWRKWPQGLLRDKRVTLLGVGSVAEGLAPLCKAFGMGVTGVTRRTGSLPGFDRLLPPSMLAQAAADSDFLIVLAPYGPATHHLVDAPIIAALPRGACLVNLARGAVVEEAALIAALEQGRIAGAGLDVFETEPLPPDNPLWAMENVLLTPHIGGISDVYVEQALPIVEENIAAFLAGRMAALRNLVPPADEPVEPESAA